MKTKKKHNSFFLLVFILFTLVLFTSMISSGMLAKYTGGHDTDDNASVAKFDVDISLEDEKTSTKFIALQEYTFNPGSEELININLNGSNNEVEVKCTITFEVISALPLEIIYNSTEVSSTGINDIYIDPLGSADINNIKIKWDAANNSYLYNGQVASITIRIFVEQVD